MKTQEEITRLLSEFKTLNKLSDKFDFWQTKLKIEYYNSFEQIESDDWISPFVIVPKTAQETEEINNYLIDMIKEKKPNVFLNIDNLINEFNHRLNPVDNKIKFVTEEIQRVKSKAEKPNSITGIKNIFAPVQIKESYCCQSYENYLFYNIGLDLKEKVYHPSILIKELNGQTWAEYELYLTDKLNPSKEQTLKEFTHIEQMLILDYMGIGKNLNNTKRALLFQAITGRDKETTRQYFSELEKSKKRANLKEIKSLFEKIGYESFAKQVEKEIIKHQVKK